MRLRTFYVKSYRSIIEATLEDIQKYCAIVGPNNSGKSNLLRAIYIALSIALEVIFEEPEEVDSFIIHIVERVTDGKQTSRLH